MPESKGRPRKSASSKTGADGSAATVKASKGPSPRWYAVLMVGLMIIGLVWIVVFYLSAGQFPVPPWGNWNLAAGFGLIIAGFLMTTNWR